MVLAIGNRVHLNYVSWLEIVLDDRLLALCLKVPRKLNKIMNLNEKLYRI